MIARIVRSKLFNQGFMTAELLAAAQLDMDIHTLGASDTLDPTELERRSLYEQRGLLPQIAPRYRYPYFAHIFNGDGYAAGYYSYLWSQSWPVPTGETFSSGAPPSREPRCTGISGEAIPTSGRCWSHGDWPPPRLLPIRRPCGIRP